MSDEILLFEKQDRVATVTLNRPDKLNAFDKDLRAAMRYRVGKIEDDPEVAIVVLKGAGRGFSAGADLSDGMADPVSFHLDDEYKPFLTGIAMSNKIWIAQVHGACAGVGAAVAMNCDFMTMSDDAYIYLAFAAIALVPDGGNTQLLFNAMGYKRALEAAVEGRKIPADECMSYGICNRVISGDDLETETAAWAKGLSEKAPLSLAATKRLMRKVGRMSFGDAISAEGLEQAPLLKSEDFTEGVRAFFAKEKPDFKGR